MKIVDKSKVRGYKSMKRLDNEIKLTQLVDSPNVARLIETIQTREHLYLVLEHGGQDLFSYLSSLASHRLEEAVARPLLAQLVAGVRALDAKGLVHHDIKSENLLIETDASGSGAITRVRLTDLGMSERYARGDEVTAFCGSPGFFPPEMALAASYDPFKVDVWSVGCVAVELLLGQDWFKTHWLPNSKLMDSNADFAKGIRASLDRLREDLEASQEISEGMANFILECLVFDPRTRPTIEAVSQNPIVSRSIHTKRLPRPGRASNAVAAETSDDEAESPRGAVVTPPSSSSSPRRRVTRVSSDSDSEGLLH